MGLFFSDTYLDLGDLLYNQLCDLYDAEHQILDALPKVIEKCSSAELKTAFKHHLLETEGHITKLEKGFTLLGKRAERESCDACEGLIQEASELLDAEGSLAVIDAGLILACQRIEHYEIAGYGGAKAIALQMGRMDLAAVLNDILQEEKAADEKLTEIAVSTINKKAANKKAASVQTTSSWQ